MRSTHRFYRLTAASAALVAALLATATCSDGPLVPVDGLLPLGTWGGEGAGVIATATVTHVHIGCTFGDIDRRLEVDRDGRFTVDGSFVLRAFPVMVGPLLPAHFSGRLDGRVLTVSVAVNDTVEHKEVLLGPVTVVFERPPELGPCPICTVPRPAVMTARRAARS